MTLKEKKLNALKKLLSDVNSRAKKFLKKPDDDVTIANLEIFLERMAKKLNDYEQWCSDQRTAKATPKITKESLEDRYYYGPYP